MKIKTQIFVLGLLLTILPLTLVSATLITTYEKELTQVVTDELRNVTASQIDIIDNFFKERDTNLDILSDYDILHELLLNSNHGKDSSFNTNTEIMKQIFETQKSKRDFLYSITALDRDFCVLISTESTVPNEKSCLAQFDFIKTLGKCTRFSPIVEAGEHGVKKRCLVAVKGIYDNTETLIGYMVEEIALDFFEELRIPAKLLSEGTIYITDGNENLITAGTENTRRQEFVLKKDERNNFLDAWNSRNLTEPIGIISYNIGMRDYLTCYGGFNNADWQILSSICVNDVIHTKENSLRVLTVAGLSAAILLLMVNLIMHRMVSAPIEKMVNTFNLIRKDRDFSHRIEDFPHNEIGIIAGEVNNLLEDIDITMHQQKERLQILKEQAERDDLTELFNKGTIREVWSIKAENAHVSKGTLTCVLVDIDDFKSFNTRFGHLGGDTVIRFVASLMRELSNDTAGRIGGDEFIMYLDFLNTRNEADVFLKGFLSQLSKGVDIRGDGQLTPVACSIGAALFDSKTHPSYDDAVEAADKTMYSVKNSSKNNYAIYQAK